MAEQRVYVVTDAEADGVIAREIARAGSDTRRALNGWALEGGGLGGGGGTGGGTVVVGESPVRLEDQGDGTGLISAVTAGATLDLSDDGTYVTLTLTGGGAA